MIRRWPILLLAACLLFSGCAHWPHKFSHPGTMEQQRLRATIHDPYADPNAAPELDGMRPRDYLDPLPEAVRNRIYVDSWWGR
jgi:hypothetical protein